VIAHSRSKKIHSPKVSALGGASRNKSEPTKKNEDKASGDEEDELGISNGPPAAKKNPRNYQGNYAQIQLQGEGSPN